MLVQQKNIKNVIQNNRVKFQLVNIDNIMPNNTINMNDFKKYRDGFGGDIYFTNKKKELLDEFLEQYKEYQVVSAKQVAEWVDSTTNQINANNVWDVFPRYGVLCQVQQIYDQHENRLFIQPVLKWLDQWDGNPGAPPSADEMLEELTPVQDTLKEQQTKEARHVIKYVLDRFDEDEVPDPKEAILYAKTAAPGTISIKDPDISVEVHRLDEDEFEDPQPDSYDALRVAGEITGTSVEIPDWDEFTKALRPVLQLFTLAGCYHFKAAQVPSGPNEMAEVIPAQAHRETIEDNNDHEEEQDLENENNETNAYAPYVINKTDFVHDSHPPEISREDDNLVTFRYQLGPTWTRWEVEV